DAEGLSATADLVVTVTDVNEPPTGLSLSKAEIAETAQGHALIGRFTVLGDPDAGEQHTPSLVEDPSGKLVVQQGELRLSGALDFETAPSHEIRVRAVDRGGLAVERDFVITVLDAPEPPGGIALSGAVVAERA